MNARRAGMTLIELLIGIVITGAAIAAGYATFATLVDQNQRAKIAVDLVTEGAGERRMLRRWIENGRPQLGEGNVPRNGLNFGMQGMRDELRLYAITPTPVGNWALITLFVNTDNPQIPRGLVAQFTMPFRQPADSTVMGIDSTVRGMRVEFLIEQQTVRQWIAMSELAATQMQQPPLAVRLTFASDGALPLTPMLRIPLTVPLRLR